MSVLCETIDGMAYVRDPLSVLYDEQTGKLLDRLYCEISLPASVAAFVKIPLDDPPDDVDGSLTVNERAFVRSLYHQNKLRHSQAAIRKPQWHEVTPKGRRVTITMFTASSGVHHVEQHPESSYAERPELRSSGLLPHASELMPAGGITALRLPM
jgi:hypothetical protein